MTSTDLKNKKENSTIDKTDKKEGSFPLKAVYNIPLEVNIVLGSRKMSVAQVLDIKPNSIIELDRKENEPVEIHINGRCVAYGEVIIVGDKIGVTITSIVIPDSSE
ncbi:FliM/FliN family flagellar motor switch protein [Lyticum sinuosum]|uniref:Flagellar motor switch protein FliN n=1 Tax=Lyticum sinuosum TaxID=1332059 RepID=A0AAE4VJQ9_9RICK|nr:FliM/FliN family flagellar motor switch protein [Lyticum sinuosum]MDZ5761290.1 Flagellar motor switch protein FliN [Lyticum sinuosum]